MELVQRNLRAKGINPALALAGIAAATAILGTATAGAAIVTSITASDVPVSDPTSVFDASNIANTYSLAPATNFIPAGFDVRDLFGGSFGTFSPEQNDVIFDNNQPIGTVDSVNVTLAAPVSLTDFNLYLEDDGSSGDRSAREFLLYSNGTLIDDVQLLDNTNTQTYTDVYGSNYIDISDTFSNLPLSSNYTLDLVQNRDGNGQSGVRALEFTATGTSTPAAVPEPASMAALIAGGAAVLRRRRRA